MKPFVKRAGLYARILVYLMVGGYVLLLVAGMIPQSAVGKRAWLSATQLTDEGYAPTILVGSDESYRLNNGKEARMLLSSLYMNTWHSPSVILLNPTYVKDDTPIEALDELAWRGAFPAADTYEPGSIMGYRSIVRALLSVMNLRQIRRLAMWVTTLLFAACVMSIRKHSSPLVALLFAAAFLSVNPLVVMSSMQYAGCFIIAFTAMLFMPRMSKWKLPEPAVFFLIGGLTQFFDAYSFPAITFGLPMIVRLLVKQREGELTTFRDDLAYVGKCFAGWLAAYVLVWLSNIAVTGVFLKTDAWTPAWNAVADGLGLAGGADPVNALLCCVQNLTTIECALCLVGFVVAWPFMLDTRARRKVGYKQGRIFLIVALLPVLWIMAASKSAVQNGYYQYRVLVVTIFAALCCYAKPTHLLEKNMKKVI